MNIAVTGASGWIGREVCDWLEGQGHSVRRLTRTGASRGTVCLDITAAEHDACWREALSGCSAVIHCAAHVHHPLETEADRNSFLSVNVNGTAKLLAACGTAGISRFVLASSSAVYDWSPGGAVAEDAAVRPSTAYAASKLQAEDLVRESGLDWRIARLATVFGAGDTANFRRLARALKARRFILPGTGEARKSVLTASRAGQMLGRLATQEAGRKTVLNLAAPDAPTLREICEAFSRRCGFPAAPAAPVWLLRGAARVGDIVQGLGWPVPLTTDTLKKLTTSTVLDVTRMQHTFSDLIWPDFEEELSRAAHYYAAD
jgi:nucleoside-diphosphate-sugar epimerase